MALRDLQGPQALLDPQDHLGHRDCQERLEFLVKLDRLDQLGCLAKMDSVGFPGFQVKRENEGKRVRMAFLEKLALRVNQGAVANLVSRVKRAFLVLGAYLDQEEKKETGEKKEEMVSQQ